MYGAGSGPIVLNGLNCLGSEPTLLGCSRSNPFSCTHHSDAGVQCKHIVYSGELHILYTTSDMTMYKIQKLQRSKCGGLYMDVSALLVAAAISVTK